jgi:replicative DNA helicase
MSSLNKMQEYQALGFFTSGLKDIASTLSIPVVTAAQTNRTNLGEVDKDASSIGGSYRILQLATKLLFLVNKSDKQISESGIDNGNQVLSIKYQRNGASDCDPINIMFYKNILFQKEAH